MATLMYDIVWEMETAMEEKSPDTELYIFTRPFATRMRKAQDAGDQPLNALFDQCLGILVSKIKKGASITQLDIAGFHIYQNMYYQDRSRASHQAYVALDRQLAGWKPTPEHMLPEATLKRRGPSQRVVKSKGGNTENHAYIDPMLRESIEVPYPIDDLSYFPINDNANLERVWYWSERKEAGTHIINIDDVIKEWNRLT